VTHGTKVVNQLRQKGHEVIAASPNTGINTITGEGLAAAMKGTDTVIDLANSPSFEDKAVLEFFQTSGRKEYDRQNHLHCSAALALWRKEFL